MTEEDLETQIQNIEDETSELKSTIKDLERELNQKEKEYAKD